MPVYEYLCSRCGGFTATRPMAEYRDPAPCPECRAASPRAVLSAPAYSGMPAAERIARATNERARHEPRLASQTVKRHGPGCDCCGKKSNANVTAHGEKVFTKQRPWMISH